MKNLSLILFTFFMSLSLLAQVPQSFKYQAVARNNAGDILASKNITFRMTILKGELPGTVVYTEIHFSTTNPFGLATLEIGRGTPVTGSFASIDWGITPIFMKTEIDPAGGSSFVESGISELLSVPFALYSKNTANNDDADADPSNELQTVSQLESEVTLSQNGGSFIAGIKSYTQQEIDAMTPYNGLTVHNATTNCINYFYLDMWFEACGTCAPQPTQANAGADQTFNDNTTTTTLAGNNPANGTGIWTVLSGNNGRLSDPASFESIFKGESCTSYTLEWTIANYCGSTSDQVVVTFFDAPTLADAGNDTIIFGGEYSVILNANFPENGEGRWRTINGEGGSFEDTSDPHSRFTGLPYVNYTLQWSIATLCDTTFDNVKVYFDKWICGVSFTDARDKQEYETVQINSQCWMAQNLNIGTQINGSSNQTNNGTIEKYCYTDSEILCDRYGGLYQWNEMMNYTTTTGTRGICPAGWHLPSVAEWATLAADLGGESVAGGKMKETGTTHWNSPNTDATNSSGFTGLPGGYRGSNSIFYNIHNNGDFWSSSQINSNYSSLRILVYDNGYLFFNNYEKAHGFSVRCLKNDLTIPTTYYLDLKLSHAGAGIVSGQGSYEAGEVISVMATANPGWEFVNWTDAGGIVSEEEGFTYTMPALDVTLTANFTEQSVSLACGDVMIDTRDGQSYSTVKIGDQCWMAQNLNTGTRINGPGDQTDNGIIEKYCYDDSDALCDVYGGLYQWNEIMKYTTAYGWQGICPNGWHLPTDDEWCTLEQEVDPTITCNSFFYRGVDGGSKLKESGNAHWIGNSGATNSSGFTGLPGGNCNYFERLFEGLGGIGDWWSSSRQDDSAAFRRYLNTGAQVFRGPLYLWYGLSVRCLKNDPSAPTTFSLSVEVNTSGAGTVNGQGNYATGTEIQLSASAGFGWEFVNWTDAAGVVSGEANFTYTMPAQDITLTANFVEQSVTLLCGDDMIDVRDGQSYSTVEIGNQCWMYQNLNIGTRINGSNEQTNNSTIEKYCYSNSNAQCEVYGGLYQWNEMMGYTTTAGVQGICPAGWHLPTHAEWTTLTTFLGGASVAGGKMKEAGTTHWNSPNTGATNSSGFTGLPCGYRTDVNSFTAINIYANWWSSTDTGTSYAWYRYLSNTDANVWSNYYFKTLGLSVRCLKD